MVKLNYLLHYTHTIDCISNSVTEIFPISITFLGNSPHSCSSDPSRQSFSPSHTCLYKTHSVPSLHGLEPVRHLRMFARVAGEATVGQLTSSELSRQWERPSQTRFLEMQLPRSVHLKSSKIVNKRQKKRRLKQISEQGNFFLMWQIVIYWYFTFRRTCGYTKVLIISVRAVLIPITQLDLWEADWCVSAQHRGFIADWSIRHYGKLL